MTTDFFWRLSEAQTQALSAVTLLWTTSLEGEINELNPGWEWFTGQAPQDYLGCGWIDAVHPEDRNAVMALWKQSVGSHARFVTTYRLRHRDGHYKPMAVVGTVVMDGEVATGWIGSSQDITDARRNEVALRQSEERLRLLDELGQATRTLADASQIMALTACKLGEYLGADRCAYADVEANGDTFTIRSDWSRAGVPSSVGVYSLALFGPQAVHDLRRERFFVVNDVDRELGEDGGGRMFNAIGIKAIVCAPLVKAGQLVAMMAVHQAKPRTWTEREIAIIGEVVERCWAHIERVRSTALLREQDRRKDEFLATLAHELRNPLAPVRYAAAIMERVPPGSAQARQAQQIIGRQAGMMSRLVDDLLDLSRINRGLIDLRKEEVDLRQLVAQAVETSQGALDEAGHQLQLSMPAAVMIEADQARMVQIVSNLLNNAAKYTPQGGQIRLAAWVNGRRAFVEVNDNGIGIPPEEQGKLFQMFTQLPHTAKRSQGGLGIGLSLVKTLVTLHGGLVRVHSAGLDQGTTFTIELPLSTPTGPAQPDAARQPGESSGGVRVLVVEDNADGREALVTLLELTGYEVAAAEDGLAGLALAATFAPHIGLLDLGLPKMDGLTLAQELRRLPQLAGTRLVALTGWGSSADRAKTQAAGFDRHLTKPVDVDELLNLLDELAANISPSAAPG